MASATGRELAATTGTSAGGSGAGTTGVILIAGGRLTDLRNLPLLPLPTNSKCAGQVLKDNIAGANAFFRLINQLTCVISNFAESA